MVYGQQPQQPVQPYGAQPVQYGAQPMPQNIQPDVKWSGLSTSGAFKIPVIAFIGRLTEMVYDTQSTFGLRVVEKFDQVQILESPVPWPLATLELSVKYSDREESGWGRHVGSAKALGLAQQANTLDQAKAELIGKIYEMRQTHENYGEDSKSGQTLTGDVWRFVRVVGAGGQATPQPQYAQPVAPAVPAPAPTQPQVATVVMPTTQQAPAPQPATAIPQPMAGFDATLLPDDTAPVRARKLLHGKALNEFLGVALIDDKIKADSSFVNSIFDQSFIVGLKAAGQAVQEADGKFRVVI